MGLIKMFGGNDIKSGLTQFFNNVESAAVDVFIQAGEEFVNQSRQSGEYTDRTGNLRSSIGYIVVHNGEIVTENFQQASQGTDKETGIADGRRYAESLIDSGYMGIALICVAGMNYAAALESGNRKTVNGRYYTVSPRDVISGTALKMNDRITQLLTELIEDINNVHDDS